MLAAFLLILVGLYASVRVVGEVAQGSFLDYVDMFQEKLGLSNAVAGELFQSIGTSAPEIAITAYATYVASVNPAVGVSTIIGSALFQITVVIAAPILFSDSMGGLQRRDVVRSAGVYGAAVILLVAAAWDGVFHAWELAGFVVAYAVYAWYLITRPSTLRVQNEDSGREDRPRGWFWWADTPFRYVSKRFDDVLPGPKVSIAGVAVVLFVIAAFCAFTVELAEAAGRLVGLSSAFMALTVLAAGSSVPELASNAQKAREEKLDQVFGNALGSNTFDVLMSFGGVSLIAAWTRGGLAMPDPRGVFVPAVLLLACLGLVVASFWAADWEAKWWTPHVLLGLYAGFVVANFVV